MGLSNSGGNRTYLKISDGRVAMRCDATEEGAIFCENKDKTKSWHEKRFTTLSGFITNVSTRETDWGKDLTITIVDGETFELQMPYDSSYAKGFFKSMPNIDFTKKIVFNPWMKVVDDKKKTALYLKYEGEQDNIEWFWSKDEPKDLPPMVETVYKGKNVWDDTEQMNYLWAYYEMRIAPKITLANNSRLASQQPTVTSDPQSKYQAQQPVHERAQNNGDLPWENDPLS